MDNIFKDYITLWGWFVFWGHTKLRLGITLYSVLGNYSLVLKISDKDSGFVPFHFLFLSLLFFLFVFEPHPAVLGAHSWLCALGSIGVA